MKSKVRDDQRWHNLPPACNAPSYWSRLLPFHALYTAFNEICDRLTAEILAELGSKYEMTTEALDWIRKMIEYNVKGGKLNRGLTVGR